MRAVPPTSATRALPSRNRSLGVVVLATAIATIAVGPRAMQGTEPNSTSTPVLAPGWEPLGFPPPAPGSYELPPLGAAGDGDVLDSSGRPRRLFDFFGRKIVLLSFIYTSCPDANACPMAAYVLSAVQRRLLEHPHRRDDVRLITISFDPEHDGPQVMRAYGEHLRRAGVDWEFLTAASDAVLAPLLSAYGQSVRREYDENGRRLATIAHILRVFLIDREQRIRNVYTTSFLHADTLWSDIETLAREATTGGSREHTDGGTGSKRVTERPGRPTDVPEVVRQSPLGLPAVTVPADNPITSAKIVLGRKLFFEPRLSHNDTMSCAMCHIPAQGFANNEMATAIGIEGQTVRRNAPTIYNVAFLQRLFHDGRESRLEQQIWGPLLALNEMGNPSIGYVLDKVRELPEYTNLFASAFLGRGLTMETLGMALASYERTLISAASPFDRWHFGKQNSALSAAAQRGFQLFAAKAGCAGCHTIAAEHALFTDQEFHNTGIGYRQAMGSSPGERQLHVAPGRNLTFDPTVIGSAAERLPSDLGRYEITGDPDDRWRYRTPSLRNVALTAPYMHDGSLRTLREVVEYYNAGGVPHALLDGRIRPLALEAAEIDELVAFLESLTGDNVDTFVADAAAAPVGDPY